jgi:hydroxyacylglutathione hydrolase
MVLKRLYDEKLAQASYLLGCARTGEAVVIDPTRDADKYVDAATKERLRITAVTETHIHADYLSGTRELAARTGARMYLSDEGGPDWRYAFRDEPGVTLLRDGDSIRVGNVRLDVVHTPGHTPEHIAFILTDEPATDRPLGAFTGDFIFVGDVGRPDLLERAANIKGTMEVGGKQLYKSLTSFRSREDSLLIWPGHGAGSACGKSLGGVPVSSLGYEKVSNWAFKSQSECEFVEEVLSGQPEPPKYFATMKRLNKEGPRIIGRYKAPARIDHSQMLDLVEKGAQVVDLRDSDQTENGFIPGTINIPEDIEFIKWAGWLLKFESPIYLIGQSEQQAIEAAHDLALIGLDDVRGWADTGVLRAYEAKSGPLAHVEHMGPGEMGRNGAVVLDVRSTAEYGEGHVPGAIHIPLGYLSDRLDEIPRDRKVAIHCESGSRSRLAIMLIRGYGVQNACNVRGGFSEYKDMGGTVEVGAGHPERVKN